MKNIKYNIWHKNHILINTKNIEDKLEETINDKLWVFLWLLIRGKITPFVLSNLDYDRYSLLYMES